MWYVSLCLTPDIHVHVCRPKNQKLVKTNEKSRIINTLPARDKEATCLKNK